MKKLLVLLLSLALCIPARAVVFSDTFTGGAGALTGHTSDVGSLTNVDSHLALDGSGNAQVATAPSNDYYAPATVSQTPGSADQQAVMVLNTGSNSHYSLRILKLRWDTVTDSYYSVQFASDHLYYRKFTNGAIEAETFFALSTPMSDNGQHTVRIDVTGPTNNVDIVIRVDGTSVLSANDHFGSTIDAPGKFGFAIQTSPGIESDAAISSVSFDVANPNLTSGTANSTTATDVQVNLSASAATGGAGSYTYRWHRAEAQGFTPSPSTALSSFGAYLSYADTTAVSGKLYYYELESTDGTDTVLSGQVAGRLWKPRITLGFIGDSITGGYDGQPSLYPPGVQVGVFYANFDAERIVSITHGDLSQYGGTLATPLSGHVDWQPGGSLYESTKAAFLSAGVTHVVLTLGTNDALYGVAAADYGAAIGTIVTDLVGAGFKVVINCPTGQNPAFPGLPTNTTGLLADYPAQIKAVVAAHAGSVFLGDEQMRYRLLEHPDLWISSDGTHLYQATYDILAQFWAGAIYRVLNPQTVTGGGSGIIGSGFLGF